MVVGDCYNIFYYGFPLELFIMMEYVIMLETKWEVKKKSQGKKVNNLIGLV